jgi:hypothetical protein
LLACSSKNTDPEVITATTVVEISSDRFLVTIIKIGNESPWLAVIMDGNGPIEIDSNSKNIKIITRNHIFDFNKNKGNVVVIKNRNIKYLSKTLNNDTDLKQLIAEVYEFK